MQSYKFKGNLALASLFAESLVVAIRRHSAGSDKKFPDHVIPLPLARSRMSERGFNQSAVLAERVSRILGLSYAPDGLLKVRDTPPQAGLNREARLRNVRGAFDCVGALRGQHIALVDDVMTTGATLSEAAQVLKKAGAEFVSAWVVARADHLTPQVSADDSAVPFN